MLTITDAKGQVYVSNTYDSNDAITQQVYGGDTYSYNYTRDNTGRITKVDVNNGRNVQTSYTFNVDGLVTKRERTTTNGGTELYVMAYNNDGRMVSYSYPTASRVAMYSYDNQGRVYQRTVMAGSLSQQWTYSYVGDTTRIAAITEPNGQVTQFNYDAKGNLVKTTQLNVDTGNGVHNLETTYSYNADGLLVSMTDPQNITTSFAYNVKGDIESITKAGDTINLNRDNYGNIVAMTDAEGNTSTFDYNNFNQLIQSTTAEGIVQSMQYDATNNQTASDVQI